MMNQSNPFRHLAVAVFACLMAASCSDVTDDSTALPDGKYPMTFTASVDGLTTTRATTDNNSRWTGGEQVNIQVNNTSKTYTATSDGALTLTDGFYWQDKNSINVKAWYPVNFNLANITRQNDGNNYAQLDFLYAPQSSVPFNTTASLNFEHRMTKVTATLKAGSGLTDSDLQNAEVKFYGYTTATVDCAAGTITSPSTNAWITAYPSGSSYSALLVPQSPFTAGEKFISVTISGNTYYYTPSVGDADTEAGKAYNYTITVHKSGMIVSADGWESMGDVTGANDTEPYIITVTGEGISDISISNTTDVPNGKFSYPLDATDNPVLTFKVNEGKGVTAVELVGWCKYNQTFDVTQRQFTFTLSDISTSVDIHLVTKDTESPQVGYLVYEDKTISQNFINPPAGIVYKIENKKVYVVALESGGYINRNADYWGAVSNHKPAIQGCSWGVSEQSLRDIFAVQEANGDSSWPSHWKRLYGQHWYGDDGISWGWSIGNATGERGHFNKDYPDYGGANTRAFCTITMP